MNNYTIYTHEDRGLNRLTELLDEQGAVYGVESTVEVEFTQKKIVELLESLGMWAVDLVNKEDVAWQDSHLNEESQDEEIVDFIVENPEVIRTPIVVREDGRAVYCDPSEEVLRLFS